MIGDAIIDLVLGQEQLYDVQAAHGRGNVERSRSMMVPCVEVDLGGVVENIFDHRVSGALDGEVDGCCLVRLGHYVERLCAGDGSAGCAGDREGWSSSVRREKCRQRVEVA